MPVTLKTVQLRPGQSVALTGRRLRIEPQGAQPVYVVNELPPTLDHAYRVVETSALEVAGPVWIWHPANASEPVGVSVLAEMEE